MRGNVFSFILLIAMSTVNVCFSGAIIFETPDIRAFEENLIKNGRFPSFGLATHNPLSPPDLIDRTPGRPVAQNTNPIDEVLNLISLQRSYETELKWRRINENLAHQANNIIRILDESDRVVEKKVASSLEKKIEMNLHLTEEQNARINNFKQKADQAVKMLNDSLTLGNRIISLLNENDQKQDNLNTANHSEDFSYTSHLSIDDSTSHNKTFQKALGINQSIEAENFFSESDVKNA